MSAKTEWSPYGLEAIRIAHLRRRRLLGLLALVALGALLTWGLQTTTTTELDIAVNGNRGNSIRLDTPDDEPRNKPVTVSLSPGRVTRADTANPAAPQDTPTRSSAPVFDRGVPYNFGGLILLVGPWALLGGAVWLLGKRRGKHDEVNYGVYKGAMPLEMITASASRQVFTRKHARASLFGRKRVDHVPAEVLRAEPVGEEA